MASDDLILPHPDELKVTDIAISTPLFRVLSRYMAFECDKICLVSLLVALFTLLLLASYDNWIDGLQTIPSTGIRTMSNRGEGSSQLPQRGKGGYCLWTQICPR